jgi:AraC-like DNA-binding protein
MKRMSYLGRFVRPFGQLLARYPAVSRVALDGFRALAREPRVAALASHEALTRWVAVTGDAALGLQAGQLLCFGEGGVLDFAMHSAPSLRDASELASRQVRLYGDALQISLEVTGERALLRFHNQLGWPRVVADFALSAWYNVHLRRQLPAASDVECWFGYEAPSELADYQQAFASARVKFGMSCYGFVFDAKDLDAPLLGSDASLHAVHISYLTALVERLADRRTLAPRVSALIAEQMSRGRPSAAYVTRRLKISRRTLSRRLVEEGTSFKALLDDSRRRLALRFITAGDVPLDDISTQLGFARVQGFHRAFRRWSGTTPGDYRRLHAETHAAP